MAQRYEERLYTLEEYLALEAQSLEKHEYFQGRIYQMAGGSPEHAIITNNTSAALTLALRGKPCIVYSSDVHIQVEANGLFTYADVTVVCGQPRYVEGRPNRMLANPGLLVEVLSPSTESYDRGAKFKLYKGLASFQDYLLIDSREIYVQHYCKLDANTWLEKTYDALEQTLFIENLGINLILTDIYAHIEFNTPPLLH